MSKRVAELEARCAEAYAEGLARDPPTVDLNERFNVRLLTGLFTRVPVAETIALLQASQLRSDALTLARTGTLEAAGRLLQAAESLGAREILADEAHLVDESYQRSATAYMHYRAGDFAAAERDLHEALDCCHALAVGYGHRMDMRRVELARHLIRVIAKLTHDEAFDAACLLIRYIEGDEGCWPFPGSQRSEIREPVPDDERDSMLDQVIADLDGVLRATPASTRERLNRQPELFWPHDPAPATSRGRNALAAERAALDGDLPTFLERAAAFFAYGTAYMPRTWEALARSYTSMYGDPLDTAVSHPSG